LIRGWELQTGVSWKLAANEPVKLKRGKCN
jgi:hypothetical protein